MQDYRQSLDGGVDDEDVDDGRDPGVGQVLAGVEEEVADKTVVPNFYFKTTLI